MKRLIVGTIAVAVLIAIPRLITAQTKTISSEMRVETGVVEAIEASSRKVTLRKPDGTMVTTVAGPEIKRFDEVKIGDKTVEVCCEECGTKLREASAKQKKRA